jgi:5-formyltetrahydrofolate cyclo-ligase
MDIGCAVGDGKVRGPLSWDRYANVEKPDCFASTVRFLIAFSPNFFSSSLPAARGTMQSVVREETRNQLRNEVLQRRSALPSSTCRCWSSAIQAQILGFPQYLASPSVALYSPIRNEVETDAIMDDAFKRQKRVFCPKMNGSEPGVFLQIFSRSDLVPGPTGVAEPSGHVRFSEADREGAIVIVPGVVFDELGNRLGRGGGWYDRALRWFDDRGVYVGLAYEFQVVDKVPAELWDEKVHYVVTESRVINCGVAPRRPLAQ